MSRRRTWREADHPRDRIGRFDEPPGSPAWLKRNHGGRVPQRWAARVGARMAESRYHAVDWSDVKVNGVPSKKGQVALPETALDERGQIATLYWCNDGICQALNNKLRGKPHETVKEPFVSTPLDLDRLTSDLDHAVSQGKLGRDAVLWRGLSLQPGQAEELFKEGAVVRDRSFAATAMERWGAERVLDHRLKHGGAPLGREAVTPVADNSGEPWMLKILAPAGTNVAPGSNDVQELILGRGTPMKVLEVRRGRRGKPGEIVVEVQHGG